MKKILSKVLRGIRIKKNGIRADVSGDRISSADYVNSKNYSSETNYLIWVDTGSFKVNIFKGSTNKWNLIHSYLCTLGKASTPTPKGTYKVGIKGLYFGVNKGYKCWYYTQFKGNYLFHSIIYNLNGSVRDGRLGMKLSDGCIRLAKENAKWIYDNIPRGTKVVIN
ncbi:MULTISPECIES: L,D-transpeptidase [Clostridium]|uniref:L,D-TPase catalytic domain-containing protein n=2 Tax=Clostridium TaxID=1485 RepID=A0A1S9NA39_CLOBE|nr:MULTISPECIES: L,D-transpeptidase [Clostridium]MBN7572749.1 L,D-transpeptidase [Clostridium beijerinckii]MBN7578089.1 L,D-transpeptidase [Clostridium beijerinckii]MBN7582522.1 L,D-transpeptidase [Clostridium beijerinckii]MBO0519650.1 L,D-transpeptidase [Clostridium beijerinckii]MZK48958.1 L,D-transpeptidase family protein [Clostridium beijerinckii]